MPLTYAEHRAVERELMMMWPVLSRVFAVAVVLGIAVQACDTQPGPEKALASYLEALTGGDLDTAYSWLSAEDMSVQALSEYKETLSDPIASVIRSRTTNSIISVTIDGDHASALVEAEMPDVAQLAGDVFAGILAAAFGGADTSEVMAQLGEKVRDQGLPTITEQQTYRLVREPAGWRIFLDLKTEHTVKALLEEARSLSQEDKHRAALKKYEEVLALDSELVEAKEGKEETERTIVAFDEKQAYVDKIRLYEFEAEYFTTWTDERVPGVKFKLKNEGDRSLSKVEVTVYFKDDAGVVIAEENFFPVLASSFSVRDSKPLKPNYIWQMEGDKFYKAETVPSEWKEGAASARITDIEFAD